MDKVKRRPRPTLALFDPLSPPSPSKPPPSSHTGLHALAEHAIDEAEDDYDDDQSFFSALGGDAFPSEGGGLVGELVATSPEQRTQSRTTSSASHVEHADLLSWDSPVKELLSERVAGPSTPTIALRALQIPLPDSPPSSASPAFDYLAPTPRPASKLASFPSSSSALAHARKIPLPESPPRQHRDVMDWLSDTPLPARRTGNVEAAADRSVRFDPRQDTTVVFPAEALFERHKGMSELPQSRTDASTSALEIPPASPSPPEEPLVSQTSPERTTLLPPAPSWADDDLDRQDDLLRTPAPRKVRDFAPAHKEASRDASTFPSPPSLAETTLPRPDEPERTTFLPSIPDLADESFADLMTTPAPKRVQSLAFAADVSVFPTAAALDDLDSSVSSTATVAATAEVDKTTILPVIADESYDDLMATPAPRRVKVFPGAADVTSFPSPPSATPPGPTTNAPALEPPNDEGDRTTFLPSLPDELDESYDDLLTTPAPARVRSFAPDVTAFPSPPSMVNFGASTASSSSSASGGTDSAPEGTDGDHTGFWPAVGPTADETFDDLMATPAPKRVQHLSVSPPAQPTPVATEQDAEAADRNASPTLEDRFGYLLASTRNPPRTPIAPAAHAAPPDAVVVAPPPPSRYDHDEFADETFNLEALDGAGGLVGDDTFDLLSTPLPSLAQSRTSNFPRTSPPSSSSPSAGRGTSADDSSTNIAHVADDTLVLDDKAFAFGDEGLSFSLLTGAQPGGRELLDGEGDGWGAEEERALERLMGTGKSRSKPSSVATATVNLHSGGSTPTKTMPVPAGTLPAVAPVSEGYRTPRQAAPPSKTSTTGSTLRRTSSAASRPSPRTSSAIRPLSAAPVAATPFAHRRSTSSVASSTAASDAPSGAGERPFGQTSLTLRRTSSVASTLTQDAPSIGRERTPARASGALRRTSNSIASLASTAAGAAPSHARTPSVSVRQPRTSIAPPPPATSAMSARSSHRRTSSVPAVGLTPLPRSASVSRLTSATSRTPAGNSRMPLVGSNPSANAFPSESTDPNDLRTKEMSARPQPTLVKKDGSRSLNSSLSGASGDSGIGRAATQASAALSSLSDRVSSSRLHARSLYALPGSSPASTASASASRLPRQQASLASGIRAPALSSAGGTKPATSAVAVGAAPTLESVRAALASLEARRRK